LYASCVRLEMALHPSALPILVSHHHRLRRIANTPAP
jgi:hypothetical protein